jgi:hypothetical protein
MNIHNLWKKDIRNLAKELFKMAENCIFVLKIKITEAEFFLSKFF